MKKKMKLEDLKVQSFVTSQDATSMNEIKGGASQAYCPSPTYDPWYCGNHSGTTFCFPCGTYYESCIQYCGGGPTWDCHAI